MILSLELYRIKKTTLDQPFALRIFGLANITIVSSDADTRNWEISAIPAQVAVELREQLRNHTERLRGLKLVD